MATQRKPSFLSRKSLLTKKEFERSKQLREQLARRTARQELKQLEERQRLARLRAKQEASVSGKIGRALGRGIQTARPGGVTSALFRRQAQTPVFSSGTSRVKRRPGRPKGTVKYRDPATGQPIGVYEYRKILRARLRNERLSRQAELRRQAITPEQQAVLRQIEARRMQQRMDPERGIIPNTYGTVPLRRIMDDITDASNLVD